MISSKFDETDPSLSFKAMGCRWNPNAWTTSTCSPSSSMDFARRKVRPGPCWGSSLILMRGSTMHDVVMGVAQGFGYCSSSWCSSCYTFHFSSSGLILVFSFHLTPREDPHHQTPLVLHLLVNHGLDFSFPTYFRSKPSQVQFFGLQGHSGQAKGGIPRVALRWLAGLPKRD